MCMCVCAPKTPCTVAVSTYYSTTRPVARIILFSQARYRFCESHGETLLSYSIIVLTPPSLDHNVNAFVLKQLERSHIQPPPGCLDRPGALSWTGNAITSTLPRASMGGGDGGCCINLTVPVNLGLVGRSHLALVARHAAREKPEHDGDGRQGNSRGVVGRREATFL